MTASSSGSVAIVGVAESDLGVCAPGTSPVDLMAQAARRALDDCGLSLNDVDGVFCASTERRMATLALCEYLGLEPRFQDGTQIGGASSESHIGHAMAAIEAHLCDVALIAHGSTQRSIGRNSAAPREFNPYEAPYRPFMPASAYALAASRHMHEYGTTREQLAEVAVAARRWALLNPVAWEKEPLSIAATLESPMVSYPLTVRDCCLVSDGGGAIIVTSAARARSLRKPPVFVLGVGEALSHASIASMPNLAETAAKRSVPRALAMARLHASDVSALEVYDAFTINTILFIEDLGFCRKGDGGPFVSGGRIGPGGTLPTNTNGGGLSYCHPGMYGLLLLVEATRQVRGECGGRQVPNCEVAMVHGNGGVLSSQCTVVLGSAATQ